MDIKSRIEIHVKRILIVDSSNSYTHIHPASFFSQLQMFLFEHDFPPLTALPSHWMDLLNSKDYKMLWNIKVRHLLPKYNSTSSFNFIIVQLIANMKSNPLKIQILSSNYTTSLLFHFPFSFSLAPQFHWFCCLTLDL